MYMHTVCCHLCQCKKDEFEGLHGGMYNNIIIYTITQAWIFFLLILVDACIRIVIGVATLSALIIGILIIVLVVLSVVVIKGRKPQHRCTCQGLFSANLWPACMGIVSICIIIIIAIDKDIETKPNDVYGLIDGELYSD